ncbi:MAG: 3'-5' exonuclease [Candidatus Marinimicrobia bacterium]|nr:3'-5' exonuclease [Candidatus Neomarinimicrobiota bacterium]
MRMFRRIVMIGMAGGVFLGRAATPPCDPAPETPMSALTFVAFDFETSGLGPAQHRVIEIGAVRFRNGEVLARASWLINPGLPIHYYARRAHGISDEDVKDAPALEEVYSEFLAFCADDVLLAHNAPFDVRFWEEELRRTGLPAPCGPVLDTLRVFRTWFPEASSHSLEILTDALGVPGDVYHRAGDDAEHLQRIFTLKAPDLPADYAWKDLVRDARIVLRVREPAP